MEPTPEDWKRLFALIKQARIAKGYPKRAPFSKSIGINDSTMAILEGARPGVASEDMLDYVTNRVGWGEGTWRRVLEERNPPAPPPFPPANATPNELVVYIDTEVLANELARRAGALQAPADDD